MKDLLNDIKESSSKYLTLKSHLEEQTIMPAMSDSLIVLTCRTFEDLDLFAKS
jgi:hypothetical protein